MIKNAFIAAAALLLLPFAASAQGINHANGCNVTSVCFAGAFVPGSAVVPSMGMYSSGAGILDFSTSGSDRFQIGGSSITFFIAPRSTVSTGWAFGTAAATATAPNLQINRSDATTGIGGVVNHVALIAQGVDMLDAATSGLKTGGTIPVVTGTGTPTIVAGSTDTAGEVTSGATATSVVITFSATKTNAPFCTVTPQTQLAAFAYTISTTAITITQTVTSGEKIDYVCFQH